MLKRVYYLLPLGEIEFNLTNAIKQPRLDNELCRINAIDRDDHEMTMSLELGESLEDLLDEGEMENQANESFSKLKEEEDPTINSLELHDGLRRSQGKSASTPNFQLTTHLSCGVSDGIPDRVKDFAQEVSTISKEDLKPLLTTLRYEFLDPDFTYSVMVNANLGEEETAKLLNEHRLHKKAIGYTIDDLKGIHPSLCMHRILLEDDHKPSIEHQRRLNPNMQEVVKNRFLNC